MKFYLFLCKQNYLEFLEKKHPISESPFKENLNNNFRRFIEVVYGLQVEQTCLYMCVC